MRIRLSFLVAGLLLLLSTSANAWWGNNGWGGWNPYPVWTPMYWAEEIFDDNDYYGPYGYPGYGYPGYAYGGYPGNVYGGYPGYGYGGYPYNYNVYPGYGGYGYPGGWGGPGWGW